MGALQCSPPSDETANETSVSSGYFSRLSACCVQYAMRFFLESAMMPGASLGCVANGKFAAIRVVGDHSPPEDAAGSHYGPRYR